MQTPREIEAQVKATAVAVRGYFAKAIATYAEQIKSLEQKFSDIEIPALDEVAKSAAAIALTQIQQPKDGKNGKDADPELIKQLVHEAVAAIPVPVNGSDGKSISVEDVKPVLEQIVHEKFNDIPQPKDGADGKDADPEFIRQLVKEAVTTIPTPTNGLDGKSISIEDVTPLLEKLVSEKVAQIPPAKDGESIPVDQVQKMIDEAVAKAVASIQLPKNGEPGRDAAHIEILPAIDIEKNYPRGTFATHNGGLFRSYETTHGMKGWECIVDGIAETNIQKISDRDFKIEVIRSSGEVIERDISVPAIIYKGVFKPGEFEPGDAVTFAGCLWHCDEKTSDKPGEVGSKGWTLAVKKGRDGKDGINGKDFTKPVSICVQ